MDGDGRNSSEDGVQKVLNYIMQMQREKQGLFYAIKNNEEAMFWADNACVINYSCFGDTVSFDTLYKPNAYKIPFVSFTGLNHHGQPVLFGCGLLFKEIYSSFVWLLQTWLYAMKSPPPASITTEPDSLIEAAISRVLPDTHHRFCKQEILRGLKMKLSSVYQSSPIFEMILMRCINESETPDEFEVSWQTLQRQFFPADNEWLQSIYSARGKWVPAYTRSTFFGEEAMELNAYFDGFVDASTAMEGLMVKYEKAVSNWLEKEQNADIETIKIDPVFKTSSPMEKQVAALYTRQLFRKFQKELIESTMNTATKVANSETTTTYFVVKYGEESKTRTVVFNPNHTKANCTCQLFEFSGIICCHVLAVLKARNVLALPHSFLLKRWMQTARTTDSFAAPECSQQSFAMRYNNLRETALKYAEDGAKSIHSYHIAMQALKKVSRKVEAATKQAAEGDESENRVAHVVKPQGGKEDQIRKLTEELESVNRRSERYRRNLLSVLGELEEQKLKLSWIVENTKASRKE